jgi:shikimate dehydrogenase
MELYKKFGLLGERLSHSFSPLIHAELGDYEYKLYEKKRSEFNDFLHCGDFDGLNVTIPYKEDVVPFCNDLSDTARTIGSVNTLTRLADGSLYGDNTDYFGFAYLVEKTGMDPNDGKVIILGNGGASLTVQVVLRDMGVKNIAVISRQGTDNYENINKHRDAMMIVNTTPVGTYPDNGISPIADLSVFKMCKVVIDLIYNPARTELLLQAEEQGILGINGLAMLVAQAKRAAELFTGKTIPNEQIDSIALKIAKQTRNIVLIGMPGCGKTSIGTELAKRLGRDFADTDEWIEKTSGKPIPAIFSEDREDTFRKMESEALRSFCIQSGLVIATGGGIIKQDENKRIIRQNGIMVFLDRDIDQLPTSGRPLSERDGISSLAIARLPVYLKWSDFTIAVRGIEQTAADIHELLFGGLS